jgi:hypothetical protein
MSTKGFFISYTKNDRTHAVTIRGWLEDAGFSVVMQDADFGVGSDFWRRGKSFFPPLSPVFIDFRDVGAALFEIKPSARSKKFAESQGPPLAEPLVSPLAQRNGGRLRLGKPASGQPAS